MRLNSVRFLNDLPIKRKLILVTVATCAAALLLSFAVLFWFQSIAFRRAFAEELQGLGAVVAYNGTAPLAFQDAKAAREVLSALRIKPYISSAAFFDGRKQLFAQYGEGPESTNLPARPTGLTEFVNGDAHLCMAVPNEDGPPGTLVLQARFRDKYRELLSLDLLVCSAVIAGAFIVILLVSSLLQRVISGPILALAEVARIIIEQEDYSTRAQEGGKDEVGFLTRTINRMLDQIQTRDTALRESEERFRLIVEQAADGLFVYDATGHLIDANRRACDSLGYVRDELLQKTIGEIEATHETESAAVTWTRLAPGEAITIYGTYRHKNGSDFPVEIRVGALLLSRGKVFLALVRDISDRRRAESELARLNKELVDTSRQAGMAEVATSVLHNVGNVLNSVNVSATLVCDSLQKSRINSFAKVVNLIQDHRLDLPNYLTQDAKGKVIPDFLRELSDHLVSERDRLVAELSGMARNIEHIKEIVAMQQSYAKVSGVLEALPPAQLIEDALNIHLPALVRHQVQIIREFVPVPPVAVDKHKVLQILINLISNAKHAVCHSSAVEKRLVFRIRATGSGRVAIEVQDNGLGIAAENVTRIFQHGFTTKKEGHGFGLHSGANAAKEMGGSLTVQSDGLGKGATFTLKLPIHFAFNATRAAA